MSFLQSKSRFSHDRRRHIPPRRSPGSRLRLIAFAPLVLFAGSCFQSPSCNFSLFCHGDADCGPGLICETTPTSFGASCIPATDCTTSADCAQGEVCTQRPSEPANNPFEGDSPGRKVCQCVSNCNTGLGGAGGKDGGGNGGGGGSGGQDGGGGSGGQDGGGGSGGKDGGGGQGGA